MIAAKGWKAIDHDTIYSHLINMLMEMRNKAMMVVMPNSATVLISSQYVGLISIIVVAQVHTVRRMILVGSKRVPMRYNKYSYVCTIPGHITNSSICCCNSKIRPPFPSDIILLEFLFQEFHLFQF